MGRACRTYVGYRNTGKQATPAFVEDELELPILTPTTFLHQLSCLLPVESNDLRNCAKYIMACKNGLWKREYLAALS